MELYTNLTWGLRPVRKRSPIKPPERAPGSNGAKHGSVLPDAIRGTRLPSSSCAHPHNHPSGTGKAQQLIYSFRQSNLSQGVITTRRNESANSKRNEPMQETAKLVAVMACTD